MRNIIEQRILDFLEENDIRPVTAKQWMDAITELQQRAKESMQDEIDLEIINDLYNAVGKEPIFRVREDMTRTRVFMPSFGVGGQEIPNRNGDVLPPIRAVIVIPKSQDLFVDRVLDFA